MDSEPNKREDVRECKTVEPKEGRIIINGYWIWWCEKHKQPFPWCEEDALKNVTNRREKELVEFCESKAKEITKLMGRLPTDPYAENKHLGIIAYCVRQSLSDVRDDFLRLIFLTENQVED